MTDLPENVLEMINAHLGGFNLAMGLRFVSAKPEEFVAELEVQDHHLMPYGLVHGGVYAAMIETVCSTAAAVSVFSEGMATVGLENATSFLRAVRTGRLRCTATPLVKGKRSHVWEAKVTDDRGRLAASGRVRLLVLKTGTEVDGESVGELAGWKA